MSAIKKWVSSLLIVLFCISLSGCWNYRGLNKISIVSGIAIDRQAGTNNYHLTMEIIDFSEAGKKDLGKPQLIESEGKTIFDAVRNAKKKLFKKLYFSDTKIIVISNQIAKEEGISSILDWFLRDAELRETIKPIISQEKTAKEILMVKGMDEKIVSEEIERMIDIDKKMVASTKKINNYQVFNLLQGEKETSLVLPAVHCTLNQDKKIVELNGVAIFKADRLQGYLSAEETQYYLFGVDEIKGSIIAFPFARSNEKNQDNFSLEVNQNKTKRSYTFDENRLKVIFDVKTIADLGEVGTDIDVSKTDTLEQIKFAAESRLKENMEEVIKKSQLEFGCDVLGIGAIIHKSDPALWYKLKENWTYYVQSMEIEIRPNLVITNTGSMK
ncbi:Ger(x)C family spore germination protein [Anaerosinus massiliensis]|uniref:Ger(x)C family spore germination protein n=1 Tax=Massilibacillus massiliensis TaxID=1806837 RepID=UPI000DA63373|nr:Ger(x)C family spore germination protein [Massilibacillus massiliensis]